MTLPPAASRPARGVGGRGGRGPVPGATSAAEGPSPARRAERAWGRPLGPCCGAIAVSTRNPENSAYVRAAAGVARAGASTGTSHDPLHLHHRRRGLLPGQGNRRGVPRSDTRSPRARGDAGQARPGRPGARSIVVTCAPMREFCSDARTGQNTWILSGFQPTDPFVSLSASEVDDLLNRLKGWPASGWSAGLYPFWWNSVTPGLRDRRESPR
jgi:hypothetical protein